VNWLRSALCIIGVLCAAAAAPAQVCHLSLYTGTFMQHDSTCAAAPAIGSVLATDANQQTATFTAVSDSVGLDAGAFVADGTNCTQPATRQVNSGPRLWAVNCADSGSSTVDFHYAMPARYSGGAISVQISAENENAAPSGVFELDIGCACVAAGAAIPSSFGSTVAASLTFATQYALVQVTAASITPSGACGGGVDLYCRGTVNASPTTTQTANTYLLGAQVVFPTNAATD
jgi:hypothetical protein